MLNRKAVARRLLTNWFMLWLVPWARVCWVLFKNWKNSDRRGQAAWTRRDKALKLGTVRGWQGTPGQGMAVAPTFPLQGPNRDAAGC
jgi:hypothetical protein